MFSILHFMEDVVWSPCIFPCVTTSGDSLCNHTAWSTHFSVIFLFALSPLPPSLSLLPSIPRLFPFFRKYETCGMKGEWENVRLQGKGEGKVGKMPRDLTQVFCVAFSRCCLFHRMRNDLCEPGLVVNANEWDMLCVFVSGWPFPSWSIPCTHFVPTFNSIQIKSIQINWLKWKDCVMDGVI